jgi:hypothetical protein
MDQGRSCDAVARGTTDITGEWWRIRDPAMFDVIRWAYSWKTTPLGEGGNGGQDQKRRNGSHGD